MAEILGEVLAEAILAQDANHEARSHDVATHLSRLIRLIKTSQEGDGGCPVPEKP